MGLGVGDEAELVEVADGGVGVMLGGAAGGTVGAEGLFREADGGGGAEGLFGGVEVAEGGAEEGVVG